VPVEGDAAAPVGSVAVEVIYCAARGQVDSTLLNLPAGATLEDALRASGLLQRHPGLDISASGPGTGIWGKPADAAQVLREGDRVEVYRPLLIEPKDARRERQRSQRRGKATPAGAMR
jgi:putative ubiquitin-RnfH superfamily antitoxin RatB of RatAB toxin-antitoxin module